MTTILIAVLLVALLAFGVPIAYSLGIAGALGIFSITGFSGMLTQISTTAYRAAADSTLASIPLFVLMAELMHQGGMARKVFDAAYKITGRLPGGVAIATVLSEVTAQLVTSRGGTE